MASDGLYEGYRTPYGCGIDISRLKLAFGDRHARRDDGAELNLLNTIWLVRG